MKTPCCDHPRSRSAFSIVRGVFECGARVRWRALTDRLGSWGAALLVLVAASGMVAFPWWLSATIGPVLAPLALEPGIAALVLPALLVSFLLVCVLVRTLLMAFDMVSIDLRVMLAAAPLTRPVRALTQIAPDLLVSALLSAAKGMPSLLIFAWHHPSMPVLNAIAFGALGNCLIGALASLFEALLVHLTRDVPAARAGATILMLLAICAALFAMTQGLRQGGLDQPGLIGAGTLLGSGGVAGVLIGVGALAASMICLIVWGWAETAMVDELLHIQHSTPRLRVHRGSFVGASMAAFWRDASNRIGLVGMTAVCLFGVWMESLTGVAMTFLVVSGVGVMLISAAGLYAYGEFLVLRWRVVASPTGARTVLGVWIAGHLLAGLICVVIIIVPVVIVFPGCFAEIEPASVAQVASLGCLSASCGLVAGRILPCDRSDFFSMAGSGTLALGLVVVTWLLIGDTGPVVQVGIGAGALFVGVAAVLLAERQQRGVVTVTT